MIKTYNIAFDDLTSSAAVQDAARTACADALQDCKGWTQERTARWCALNATIYLVCILNGDDRPAALRRFDEAFPRGIYSRPSSEHIKSVSDAEIFCDDGPDARVRWAGNALGYSALAAFCMPEDLDDVERAHQDHSFFGWPAFIRHIAGVPLQPVNAETRSSIEDHLAATAAGTSSVPNKQDDAECAISALAAAWTNQSVSGRSDESRRRGAAMIFIKSVGLMPHSPVAELAQIDGETAGEAFDSLSTALGSKWGTASAALSSLSGAEIKRIATEEPRPAWARHTLAPEGRQTRLGHAQEFVEFLRENGCSVPPIKWPHSA